MRVFASCFLTILPLYEAIESASKGSSPGRDRKGGICRKGVLQPRCRWYLGEICRGSIGSERRQKIPSECPVRCLQRGNRRSTTEGTWEESTKNSIAEKWGSSTAKENARPGVFGEASMQEKLGMNLVALATKRVIVFGVGGIPSQRNFHLFTAFMPPSLFGTRPPWHVLVPSTCSFRLLNLNGSW